MDIDKEFEGGGWASLDDRGTLYLRPARDGEGINLYQAQDIEKLLRLAEAALAIHRARAA